MKSFLQNLLIFFALALCALIAFQWVRETDLRKRLQTATDQVHDRKEEVQTLQANVRRDEQEIQRLDEMRIQVTQTGKSNDLVIFSLTRDLEKATNAVDRNQREIDSFKQALQVANENITRQNGDIARQNAEMKKLSEDRNDLVKRFNEVASNYNALVIKWNNQQEELKVAAATNAPPPSPKK